VALKRQRKYDDTAADAVGTLFLSSHRRRLVAGVVELIAYQAAHILNTKKYHLNSQLHSPW
jgi:hypothetical protein